MKLLLSSNKKPQDLAEHRLAVLMKRFGWYTNLILRTRRLQKLAACLARIYQANPLLATYSRAVGVEIQQMWRDDT